MTIAVAALTVVAVALLAVLVWTLREHDQRVAALVAEARRDREGFLDLLAGINQVHHEECVATRDERRALLDRIQHPERIQVQADPDYTPPEPPPDAAELAMVGRIVPEFVHVGTPAPDDRSVYS